MKFSLVLFTLLFCGVVKAQTGFVEFPYNPDSDGDDFIGITDLLSLLSLYESEFSEEGLFLTSDSTEALYYTGNKTYYRCHKSCNDLPGDWRIPTHDQLLDFELSQLTSGNAWIQYQIDGVSGWNIQGYSNADGALAIAVGRSNDNSNGQWGSESRSSSTVGCYCFTRERPEVEYTYCSGSDITTCSNEKVGSGWYPIGGIQTHYESVGHTGNSTYRVVSQAFWRWKE